VPSPLATLGPTQLAADLAVRDLTDPDQGGHAIQLLVAAAVARLAAACGCQVRWHRGPRVVPVEDNYDSADPRIAGQMADLAPWRPVSAMPPVRRDLSVAVAADDAAEDLGDRVRDAVGPDADASRRSPCWPRRPTTGSHPRPSPAWASPPHQKNLLVRVVLRHLERTLTDEEANQLRDRAYAALHQGSAHQWAARSP
jgi:hypothetical protein